MEQIMALLTVHFENNRNDFQAGPMKKYMRDLFPFIGIKKPARSQILKQFYRQTGVLEEPFQPEFVTKLWEKEEREYQYAALDYIERSLKKLSKEDLPLIERMITTKSWWDTVDALAPKSVAKIAKDHPEVIQETIEGW